MSKRKIGAGSTSISMPIAVEDSSSQTGAGLGGLTASTSGLIAEYRRQGQNTWTAITLSAGTLGTWSSGGFVADGSLAGDYEIGIPNAALAAGAQAVVIRLYGATNMVPVRLEIELDAVNYQLANFGILTGQMTESYAAINTSPTLAQALFEMLALFENFAISGTTVRTYQRDGVTQACAYLLNNATTPTALTRSS